MEGILSPQQIKDFEQYKRVRNDICAKRHEHFDKQDVTHDDPLTRNCPDGFRRSIQCSFCCVRNGAKARARSHAGVEEPEDSPPRHKYARTSGPYSTLSFGSLYRSLRPRASDETVARKYRAYLAAYSSMRH